MAEARHDGVRVVIGRCADMAGLSVKVFAVLDEAGGNNVGVALWARRDCGPAVHVPGGGVAVGKEASTGVLQVQPFHLLLLADVELGNGEGGGAHVRAAAGLRAVCVASEGVSHALWHAADGQAMPGDVVM